MPFSRLARVRFTALLAAIAFAAGWLTGCGNSTVTGCSLCGTTPPLNTPVVLLITTTANDALVEFNISFVSLTLTNQSGGSVSQTITQGSGTGKLISTIVPLALSGLRFFWTVSGNERAAVAFTEFAPIYVPGGEQRGGTVDA